MQKLPYYLVFLLIALLTTVDAQEKLYPKNIILFIGDGMGLAQISAGKTVKGELHLEKFKTVGLLTTHAYGEYITDSAAGATAMATGFKTDNGRISISPQKKRLKTVLEYAEERGKSTGLVVTTTITHATPACFAAHVEDRSMHNEIAEQLVESGVEVLLGGGWRYFIPSSMEKSKRRDKKNLLAKLALRHPVIKTTEEFRRLGTPQGVYGFLARKHLPKAYEREISLTEMAWKAIEILSQNENGFFLMVEGSQIDFGGHANKSDVIIGEMIDFDEAIRVGYEFAQKNGETLVLVTADHETGGYALEGGSIKNKKVTEADFATNHHTGVMVPLFAYGPGSEVFSGIHDNTFVGRKMIEYIKQAPSSKAQKEQNKMQSAKIEN